MERTPAGAVPRTTHVVVRRDVMVSAPALTRSHSREGRRRAIQARQRPWHRPVEAAPQAPPVGRTRRPPGRYDRRLFRPPSRDGAWPGDPGCAVPCRRRSVVTPRRDARASRWRPPEDASPRPDIRSIDRLANTCRHMPARHRRRRVRRLSHASCGSAGYRKPCSSDPANRPRHWIASSCPLCDAAFSPCIAFPCRRRPSTARRDTFRTGRTARPDHRRSHPR